MPALKTVIWVGSSRRDLRAFPEPVKDHMGYALYIAQRGGQASRYEDTERLWRGRGGGSGKGFSRRYVSCRAYVLHAFQKKSKTGRETGRRDLELVKQRLREAEQIAKEREP
jgi:phage-related protein